MQRPISILKKIFSLMVGVCLIGASLHTHRLLPVSSAEQLYDHHISIDQPDCIACLHLSEGVLSTVSPTLFTTPTIGTIYARNGLTPTDQELHPYRNKSPPKPSDLPAT